MNEFYAAALMYARMLVRDEPIKAKYRDWDMKQRLFTMIEWDHVARYGPDRNIRPLAAHFHEWADADVVAQLDRCWSAGLAPSSDALSSTVTLFRTTADRVAHEVALPEFDAAAVIGEIERIATACR